VPATVWELWATLPTQTLPQRGARPVKRLVALAQALSADAVSPGALGKVEQELHRILNAYATRYSDKLDSAIQGVWDVYVKEIKGRFGEKGLSYAEFVERADDRAIRSAFEAAKKAFGADIAQSAEQPRRGTTSWNQHPIRGRTRGASGRLHCGTPG
jgi:hypothetical protein